MRIALIFFLLSFIDLYSQVNVILQSQEDVNNFQIDSIFGTLKVESDSIENLDSLYKLKYIEGNLFLTNCSNLQDIKGFNNLEFLLDSLIIENNPDLSICCCFVNILNSEHSSYTRISNNAPGCNNKNEIVTNCFSIQNPCGVSNFTDTLKTADDINNFECNDYFGSLIVDYSNINDSILFLCPKTISGDLSLLNNETITDLSLLENLDSVKNLRIENCSNLKKLDGIDISLMDTLNLQNNKKLYACNEVIALIDSGVLSSNKIILDSNASSCNSLHQISHFKRQKYYPCGELEKTDTLIYQFEIDSFDCQDYEGSIYITDSLITNLRGLSNLQTVHHNFTLNNLNLTYLDTLNLSITNKFTIQNNRKLKTIENIQFNNPSNVIEFSNNDSLIEIIDLTYTDSLIIKNNKSLDNCCAIAENLFHETTKNIVIESNSLNCNGLVEIKNYCLDNAFPCGLLGVTDTFTKNSDFDFNCYEYKGSMFIRGHSLDSIDSTNNIRNIRGNLEIEELHQVNLFGFENLENINGSLIIRNNSVSNLKAFGNLNEIQGELIIDANNNLRNNPINAETAVRKITLSNNDSITSLTFGQRVSNAIRLDAIEIYNNNALEYIGGGFSEQMDSITISNNDNLTSISAISATNTVHDLLEVSGNSKLSDCCDLEPLLRTLGDTSETVITIGENADSCISIQSILNNCQIFTAIEVEYNNTNNELRIIQNNNSFIEIEGNILNQADKIYLIGISGNILSTHLCDKAQKMMIETDKFPSGFYVIAATKRDKLLKAVKLFKK